MGSREENLLNLKNFWPENAPDISQVSKYVNKYKKEKIVIKCGGKVLIDSDLFNRFIEDIAILYKLGLTVIIVHGGGPRIKNELAKLNIESQFINGLRVTDKQTMNVVEKALVDFNFEIIEKLKKKECKVDGLNVSQNNIFIVVQENKDLGFVGRPKKILNEKIQTIINQQKIVIEDLINDKNENIELKVESSEDLFNTDKKKDVSKHQINLIDIEQNKESIDENILEIPAFLRRQAN